MTNRFFWKLWPEMRLGATFTTRKQNKHQANGNLLILQNQRRPDSFDQMLGSCWLVVSMLMKLCTRILFLLDKLWINNFIWKCWKDYVIVYGNNDQKCGAAVIGFFTMTMPLPTWPWVCSSFWQKTTWRLSLILPIHLSLRHVTFSRSLVWKARWKGNFCWCQQSEKENAGSLEQHQHWRIPEMFSTMGKT